MDAGFYRTILYPLQDQALAVIAGQDTGFYLSGGTAASRAYLNNRFSDDLDLFVNDDSHFPIWADRLVAAFSQQAQWTLDVDLREERFVRLALGTGDVSMKIELINDVPSHIGRISDHPQLGRIDSAENILANKLTALISRSEPKDLADVWGFCTRLHLAIGRAIEDAQSKAAGLFPADVARVLLSADESDWKLIRWIEAPPLESFLADLRSLGESLLLDPSR